MATVTITGKLLNGLNEPLVGEYVYFRVTGAGTDTAADAVYPRKTFALGPSDASGDLPSDDIWVNGDSGVQSYYEVRMPGNERIDIIIPSGTTGTVDLSDMLTSYRADASTQQSTVLGTAQAYTNTLAADPSDNGSFNASAWRTDLNVENGADVTDTANVTAAGALMDSEVTNLAQVKAFDASDYATAAQGILADSAQQPPSEGAFVDGDKTKLDGIEALADVTDTANVTAAGALMDSEVTNLADVKAFDPTDYATAAQGALADSALQGVTTSNTVWVSKEGNDSTGTAGRLDLPFLTVGAAQTAANDDAAIVSDAGSTSANLTYSRETNLTNGKRKYVNSTFSIEWNASPAQWEIKSSATVLYLSTSDTEYPWDATGWVVGSGTSPAPTVSQRRGDTILALPGDYSAETALAGKDGVTYQGLDGAILPAFNVTTAITIKGSGLCQSLTCNNAGAVIDMPEMDTVAAISLGFLGGILTAGNAGTFILCFGGTATIRNADQAHDGTTNDPIRLSGSASLTIENSRHESTEENGAVIDIANNWSGSLKIFNSRLKATNAGTDGATIGIKYGTGVTGTVQLDGVTIETAQDGTGTAKSIDAPSAQTVLIGSPLKVTHDVDTDVTLDGGDLIINTGFTA
jgi:hypothetical protein